MLSNRIASLLPRGRTAPAASPPDSGTSGASGRAAPDPLVALRERNLSTLLAVAATNNTAWNLVTPFIPLFVLELVGGDPIAAATWSGIALGISPLMTAVAGPFWGSFAARYGARRAMMRTLLMSPALVVLVAFSTAIWQILILRFLIGVLGGFYVLVHALVGQTAPKDKVGQAIGSLQAISMITLAIIPPVAGFFTDSLGIRSSFLLGAAVMLASFWVMWRGYVTEPESQPPTQASSDTSRGSSDAARGKGATETNGDTASKERKAPGSAWALVSSPEMATVSLIIFVGQYVERVFWPLAPLLVVEMEPGSAQVGLLTGLILGIGSAATAVSALVCGRLARRVPARLLLLAALICGCLSLPVLAVMGTFWQFMAARVVMGLLTGGIVTLAYAHVSTLLPPDRLSVSFSMFASVAMVASAVGPVSMSTLASAGGLRSPLIVGAIGFGCCFVMLLVVGRPGWLARPARRREELPHGS
jgi:DHA1 family multidrug resistance protein-like MFS transporter